MADESITIQIQDKISPTISKKLGIIASTARTANTALEHLQQQLNSISATALDAIIRNSSKAAEALARTSVQAQRLKTEQERTALAAARVATEQARANAALTRGSIANQNLAAATARAETAAVRTAIATAQGAAASDRAALASLRLQQAQDRASASAKNAADTMLGYVRAAAGVLGLSSVTQSIARMSDAYTNLQNRLQNITDTQEQVNRLTGDLFDLANRTRSGVEETTTAFARFDRALKFLGRSQEETLRMTETINKALIVSGASTEEANSALLQLSQGFNAGRLMGDEFRAVAENMPIVLDAVAKALDVPINQVKELSTQGKITSEVLFDAFKLIEDQVDSTFSRTTTTISQAMTVLSNSVKQFVGEINNSTGFARGLSTVIVGLSKNLDVLAVAVTALGTAFAVQIGQRAVGALQSAAVATRAFTLALIANPIGLIAVAVTTAAAALFAFGDSIKLSADGLVTLKDAALSVFSYIGDAVGSVAGVVVSVWGSAIDLVNAKTNGWAEEFRNVGDAISRSGRAVVNGLIAFWVSTYDKIVFTWNNFPSAMEAIFVSFVNDTATIVESVVNLWVGGMRKIADLVGSVSEGSASAINSTLDKLTLELPRLQISSDAERSVQQLSEKIKSNFERDFLGEAGSAIMGRAQQIASARQTGGTELRGRGESQIGADANASQQAELRANALERINMQLDNELSRMNQIKPVREAQAELDRIEENLLKKKVTLNNSERESLQRKIEAIHGAQAAQQKMDEIYNNATQWQRDYNATLQAANELLSQGAISQSQYNTAVSGASIGALSSMGIDTSTLDIGVSAQLEQYQNYYAQLEEMRAQNAISEQDYSNARTQLAIQENQVKTQNYRNFFDTLTGLQTSNIKELAVIGKAAATTQAVINTYEGATKALAQGGIFGAAMAAAVVTAGMAQVAQIQSQSTGFRSGGYTGSGGVDEVAGVVHGQEFVMNAAATNRIGVNNLQALQSGAAQVQTGNKNGYNDQSAGGSAQAQPTNVNVDVPVTAVVVQSKEAALAGLRSSEGKALIIETIEQNGGTVAKILGVK